MRLGVADGSQQGALASIGPPHLQHILRNAAPPSPPCALTKPTSAISRSSSSYMHKASRHYNRTAACPALPTHLATAPAVPISTFLGLLLPPLANVLFPLPPFPPAAAMNSSPCVHRSARRSRDTSSRGKGTASDAGTALLDFMAAKAAALQRSHARTAAV